ncbi:hypothetical protein AO378_0366 [Moraxella catarrhalis]|nr:hypothetical protein AO378_0366 [Moraxella catarrhalis]
MGQSNDHNLVAKFWLFYADGCGGIGVRYSVYFIQSHFIQSHEYP